MKILVLNAGSSSIKYQLFNMELHQVIAHGLLERIGESSSDLIHHWRDTEGRPKEQHRPHPVSDHHQGLEEIFQALADSGSLPDPQALDAIGHRVVHGGDRFSEPTLIDEQVVEAIREMIPLAPLHNPANLEGIEISRKLCPGVPQMAVFDTAFHQGMPDHAYLYALPRELYEQHRVRRYGFHGSSHLHVAKRTAELLQQPLESLNMITLHLGNGCSAAAVAAGVSIDTSMGMTPLEGLVMGTRCGDLDPAIPFYLEREAAIPPADLEPILNKQSGLKGICGLNDMREIGERAAQGDAEAALARRMFAYRVKKYIGAYHAVLGRLDALVFTGGIGENDTELREMICEGLQPMGIDLDADTNRKDEQGGREIGSNGSRVRLLVVPTNEELEIALGCVELIEQ